MATLLAVYLIIGVSGLGFLLVSLIVGDIFDLIGIDLDGGSHDFGLLDSRVISVFLLAFGGFGAIGALLGLSAFPSALLGLAGGLALGFAVLLIGKTLYNQQSSSSVALQDLLGKTAQVSVKIMPNQIGQVTCIIGEERVEKLARSYGDDKFAVGEIVIIDSFAGDSVLVRSDKGGGFLLFAEKD